MKKHTKISLIGMMGSGKTSVAKALSEKLNISYCDLDTYIAQQENLSITQIFDKFGEKYFRALEQKYIIEVSNSDQNIIISCGGGSFITPTIQEYLLKNTKVFWLKTSAEEIYNRIKNDNTRPLLSSYNLVETIKNIIKNRKNHYQLAHHQITTDNKDISKICDEIIIKIT